MSALPLSMLEQRPIVIPTYRNERIRSFADWFRDNDAAITEYYNAVRPYCEGEPLVDFFKFAAIQHERAEMQLHQSDAVPSLTGADADAAPERSQGPRSFSVRGLLPHGEDVL